MTSHAAQVALQIQGVLSHLETSVDLPVGGIHTFKLHAICPTTTTKQIEIEFSRPPGRGCRSIHWELLDQKSLWVTESQESEITVRVRCLATLKDRLMETTRYLIDVQITGLRRYMATHWPMSIDFTEDEDSLRYAVNQLDTKIRPLVDDYTYEVKREGGNYVITVGGTPHTE